MKVRWKQFWCAHHWHIDNKSYRKVPSKYYTICKYEDDEVQRYVEPDLFGFNVIRIKYIIECCKCEKQEIDSVFEEATIKSNLREALSYPDINEAPLEL
jgi:hypothetical protein